MLAVCLVSLVHLKEPLKQWSQYQIQENVKTNKILVGLSI